MKNIPIQEWLSPRISNSHIITFTKQLANLINANIPLITAFNILQQDSSSQALRQLIIGIQNRLEIGDSFSNALRIYPQYFNNLFCSLVDVGEKAGTLDIILNHITIHLEQQANYTKKLRHAMIYPLLILITTSVVIILLILFVIPQFANLYASCNAKLPTYTLRIIQIAKYIQNQLWLLLSAGIILIWGFIWAKKTNPEFDRKINSYLLRLPLIGRILKKVIISRFTYILAMTVRAGLPITEALMITTTTCNNWLNQINIKKTYQHISNGQPLNVALQSQNIFPQTYLRLIAISEESGTLDTILTQLANDYTTEVTHFLNTLHTMLEPAIIVVLGIIVGALIIGMYLPIFNLGDII